MNSLPWLRSWPRRAMNSSTPKRRKDPQTGQQDAARRPDERESGSVGHGTIPRVAQSARQTLYGVLHAVLDTLVRGTLTNIRERHGTYFSINLESEQREIELLFVDRYIQGVPSNETTPLIYLHRVRQFGSSHSWVQSYMPFYYSNILPQANAQLVELVRDRRFDAIFLPPSRRDDALRYRRAILEAIGPTPD